MTWAILAGVAALVWWVRQAPIDITAPDPVTRFDDDMTLPTAPHGVNPGIRAMARAIADAEGFGVAGAIPTRANNPGDLVLGDKGFGVLGAQSITVFRSADDGWAALFKQLQIIADGRSAHYFATTTIAEMAATYAGPDGATNWASNVVASLNRYGYAVGVDSVLAEVLYS